MDLTVANVIDKALGIGIGQSLETKPESGTYQDLEVGEDWVGEVYPWVLDYRSNSDFLCKQRFPHNIPGRSIRFRYTGVYGVLRLERSELRTYRP